jgi:hypothetical protein
MSATNLGLAATNLGLAAINLGLAAINLGLAAINLGLARHHMSISPMITGVIMRAHVRWIAMNNSISRANTLEQPDPYLLGRQITSIVRSNQWMVRGRRTLLHMINDRSSRTYERLARMIAS